MKEASKKGIKEFEEGNFKGFVSCDALAMAVAIFPEIILSSESAFGNVDAGKSSELRGKLNLTFEPFHDKVSCFLSSVELFNLSFVLLLWLSL